MPDNNQKDAVTLPEGLRQQFAQVERRLWRVETCIAVCFVAGGLIVSFLALFVSDRIWATPPSLRLAILLLGVVAVIVASLNWARNWVWHRRDWRALARMVQKKYRRLGDRLLGIVELANEQRHQANFSAALYHAAIHQVAEEAQKYDFKESVSGKGARKFVAGVGGLCVVLAGIALVLPAASANAFLRWIAPVSNIERYTLVRLGGFPAQLIVPHGEPFKVSGKVDYRSFWKPSKVLGLLPRQPELKGAAESGKVQLDVPGQVDRGFLRVHVGDATALVEVVPTHRPSLEEMSALIELPAYLRYSNQTQIVQGSSMLTVEGSKVAFLGKVSRPLASALMQKQGDDATALQVQGERFNSASSQPSGITELTFSWRDKLGLSNAAPWRLAVQTQKDAPPTPEMPDLPREYDMLASDVLRIHVVAHDDFGVRDYGLMWEAASDKPISESMTTEIKAQASKPTEKKVERSFLWSPEIFRIPADSTVELAAFARDFLPNRERAQTSPVHIRVLSPEEHAEMVREQLEAAMAQAEEVTRLQEKIAANLRNVKEDEKLPESQKAGRLGQSKEDQLQNSRQLEQLTKQAESAVQEAMKNPVFSEDVVRKWTQTMQQWEQLSQKQMKDAAKSMQAAQQSTQQNSKSSPEDLAEASQKAQDVLDALQKMQEKANDHLDQLQALTLAQRLRKIGKQEKELGSELVKNAPDTIGLLPEELPDKFRKMELAFAGQQGGAQAESTLLQGEISRFFERTQKADYGVVSTEMKQTHASDALDRIGGMIQNNIGVQASGGLSEWSGRFHQWADKLEPKSDSAQSSQSSPSANNANQMDLTKQLIELLRLRGQELDLRDKTSVLDSQKGDPGDYSQQAGALAKQQGGLADNLDKIHKDTPVKDLEQPFKDSTDAMAQVRQMLQKPQTDKETDAAQIRTVDALTDLINLINEQAQRNSSQQQQSASQSSSAEEMAFLMQMMKNSSQPNPNAKQPNRSGNRPGGTTSRQARATSGNVNGKNAAQRDVNKADGVIQNTPVEFRDALDNYFHAIEQNKK